MLLFRFRIISFCWLDILFCFYIGDFRIFQLEPFVVLILCVCLILWLRIFIIISDFRSLSTRLFIKFFLYDDVIHWYDSNLGTTFILRCWSQCLWSWPCLVDINYWGWSSMSSSDCWGIWLDWLIHLMRLTIGSWSLIFSSDQLIVWISIRITFTFALTLFRKITATWTLFKLDFNVCREN